MKQLYLNLMSKTNYKSNVMQLQYRCFNMFLEIIRVQLYIFCLFCYTTHISLPYIAIRLSPRQSILGVLVQIANAIGSRQTS